VLYTIVRTIIICLEVKHIEGVGIVTWKERRYRSDDKRYIFPKNVCCVFSDGKE
jgi:hypothetical protein